MRLIAKFTILFLAISSFVFILGYIITVQVISREMNFEEQRFLKERLDHVKDHLKEHHPDHTLNWNKLKVKPLGKDGSAKEVAFSDTLVEHSDLESMEPHLKLTTVTKIDSLYYDVSIYDLIIEEEDIHEGVSEALIKMYLIFIVLVLILAWLFSKKLLAPFNNTLSKIKNFKIQSPLSIHFPYTSTYEFRRLNQFLQEMTDKSKRDYKALKEFTENASHEIQTPLSIARNKLELLLENENLTEEQVANIVSAQNSLQKISRLGSALSLLNKIDNREFTSNEQVNLSKIVNNHIFDFKELMGLKSINCEENIEENVYITIHPVLAESLITNLFQNAIRHNSHNGTLKVTLTSEYLNIKNTGSPLKVEPQKLFDRFQKNEPAKDSLGLGLAIVKTICDANQLKVDYRQENHWHSVYIFFKQND